MRETKYNLDRCNRVGDRYIWHIHGDVNSPNSIQLGFEHYSGQIGKITKYRDHNALRLHQTSKISNSKAWIEPFIWGDTHIIGYGLAEEELDPWWAIQYWAKFNEIDDFGSITYYSTSSREDPSAERRNALLRGFGITVVEADKELLDAGAYEKLYENWIDSLPST